MLPRTAALLVMLLAPAARPQESRPDPASELERLTSEHARALAAWRRAHAEEPPAASRPAAGHPDVAFAPRFADAARRATAHRTAIAAWRRVLALRPGKALAEAAVDDVLARFRGSPELAGFADAVGEAADGFGDGGAAAALERIEKRALHAEARARARLARVRLRLAGEPAPDAAASRRMLLGVARDHRGTRAAEEARRLVQALQRAAPGKPAPDFEAVDVSGRRFRLSEYEGRVVVLAFWGFW